MYHHLPNTTASHLAYPQLLQHQEAAWPPGVEIPGAASAVEPLPPGVKRTSEGMLFFLLTFLRSASFSYLLLGKLCRII